MPLGDLVAQFMGEIFGQVFFEGLIKKVLFPVLRFPGAVIGWMIWRGRPFRVVWEKGDGFQQGMVGSVVYILWIALAIVL